MDLWVTESVDADDIARAVARTWVRIGGELAWLGSRVDLEFEMDSLEGRVLSLLARRWWWVIHDLREQGGIDRRVMSRVVARLADRGWLVREGPARDARHLMIRLTQEGRAAYQEAEDRRVDLITDLLVEPGPDGQEAASMMAGRFFHAMHAFHTYAEWDPRHYLQARIADRGGMARGVHGLAARHQPGNVDSQRLA